MNKREFIGGSVACGLSLCSFGYTAADFAPERPDGSTMRSLAWLHGELARARPVLGDCDVCVVGAGPGGVGAAVAAARAGKRTILVEHYGYAGGVGTNCSTCTFFYETIRMMPNCLASGQIAGTAAALALDRTAGDVAKVPYAELRTRLESANHICCAM